MRINHNIAALNTYRQLTTNNANGAKSLEKLSSGYRINRAGDDAAGLAISEKMRAQIRGLGMASKNSQDAISLIQTAEGALSETHSILQRMRELGVQAANDTNVTIDRGQIQKEMDQLTSEINRIGGTTEFNTMKLLNGERAIVSTTVGTSGAATLNSGTVAVRYASGLTAGSSATMMAAVNSISITGTGADTFAGSTDPLSASTAAITITFNGTGTAGVTVTLKSTAGATQIFSATDTIQANASGDYVYNDHGVSFTISKSAAATLSTGATLGLNVVGKATSGATYNTVTDWTTNGNVTGHSTITSGITVTSNSDLVGVGAIYIEASSAGVTVNLKSGTSAGATTLFNDSIITAGGTFVYNNHGISFTLDNTILGDETAKMTLSLTSLGTTKAISNVTTTVSDKSLKFQVGANENQSLGLDISDMRAKALKISTTAAGTAGFNTTQSASDGTSSTAVEYTLDVSTSTAAAASVTVLNTAISSVSDERAKLGSIQNRLEHTINNLDTASENLQASESRIRDVDMAKEMMEFTKNNILMQAAQSMLAQANQQPQGVLQLLR